MKKKYLIVTLALTMTGAATLFTACQKGASNPSTDTTDATALQSSSSADDQSDNLSNDVVSNVLGVNDDAGLGAGIGVFFAKPQGSTGVTQFGEGEDSTSKCYTVSISPDKPGIFPKTITVDFGTGCTGRDGRTRRGKIITTYTGKMRKSGSQSTTTFDGFYIDSIKVEGTLTVKNNSTDSNLVFSVAISDGKFTAPSGNYIEVNRNHTWTQIAGAGTLTPADDAFGITGSSSGTAVADGKTTQWTTDITQQVVRKFSCRWRVSGQVTITHNSKTAVLDYGNGDCDNQATVTVNGKVFTITLH